MTELYRYRPLSPEPGTMRLLRLFKSPPTYPIRCELFEASLQEDDGTTYQALSYTWGSKIPSESITVEDELGRGGRVCYTFRVTGNLHTALRYIRSRDLDLVLWIDAICIDQKNPQEKSVQIGQMRTVYEKADEVLIWLGHGTDGNVEAAMDAMCRLHEEARSDRKAWKDPRNRPEIAGKIFLKQSATDPESTFLKQADAFKGLLARPWFQRIWVLQEVASARAASVLCGSRSISAAIFALMPSFLGLKVDSHIQAVLDILPGHSRQESWWNKRRDLHFLLKKFASSETSEPRDKIYALLGMSSDASDVNVFRPNYDISFEEVLRHTLIFLLFGSTEPRDDPETHKLEPIILPKMSLSNLIRHAEKPGSLFWLVHQWSVTTNQEATKALLLSHGIRPDSKHEEIVPAPVTDQEYWNVAAGDTSTTTTKIDREHETPSNVDIQSNVKIPGNVKIPRNVKIPGNFEKAPKAEGWDFINAITLSSAVRNDYVYGLRLLVQRGGAKDLQDGTLLAEAASAGSMSVVNYLLCELDGPVDVDSQQVDGRTALSFAAESGELEVMMLLMSHGADRAAKDLNGRRIVDWLEDATEKGPNWGSRLAAWRVSLYGSELAM
ncbi:heterokaryon incompatibility protein-domain-containing protein [Plectosphaerella cucumerina]|uniref:Heterokaryon incompatibility protein-domain-containing protein n=1 Tax=Plectosphaerella cucumerina TaxID=40658 RepID=A0A8K0X7B7_9PEZI|nr:heterokaryon incompatibility protein-domain-containing protein [Plectosphaerella cucumerina]